MDNDARIGRGITVGRGRGISAKWFLFGLVFVVLILVITVVYLALTRNVEIVENEMNNDPAMVALRINEEIQQALTGNEGYSVNDAIGRYESEMQKGNDLYKISIASYYAGFLLDYSGDINQAVDVMKEVEPIANTSGNLVSYYVMLAGLYYRVGDVGQAEYYMGLIETEGD